MEVDFLEMHAHLFAFELGHDNAKASTSAVQIAPTNHGEDVRRSFGADGRLPDFIHYWDSFICLPTRASSSCHSFMGYFGWYPHQTQSEQVVGSFGKQRHVQSIYPL